MLAQVNVSGTSEALTEADLGSPVVFLTAGRPMSTCLACAESWGFNNPSMSPIQGPQAEGEVKEQYLRQMLA